MSGSLRIAGLLLCCLALFAAPGCDNDDDDWGQVGLVHFAEVGSNCWVIVVSETAIPENDQYYEPANLPDEFKVDRLWVRFEYVVPDEWASTCMVGEGIIITRIEAL